MIAIIIRKGSIAGRDEPHLPGAIDLASAGLPPLEAVGEDS